MSILNILEFPDPRLRTIAAPVRQVDASIRQLIDDMFETMYAVVVMDISEDDSQPLVFINPKVQVLEGELREYVEGCLSVPGFQEAVMRPENIIVNALDRHGQPFELHPDGLLAVCIQHELDHLNGKLFVDYLSALKRQRIRGKLEKLQRQPA